MPCAISRATLYTQVSFFKKSAFLNRIPKRYLHLLISWEQKVIYEYKGLFLKGCYRNQHHSDLSFFGQGSRCFTQRNPKTVGSMMLLLEKSQASQSCTCLLPKWQSLVLPAPLWYLKNVRGEFCIVSSCKQLSEKWQPPYLSTNHFSATV